MYPFTDLNHQNKLTPPKNMDLILTLLYCTSCNFPFFSIDHNNDKCSTLHISGLTLSFLKALILSRPDLGGLLSDRLKSSGLSVTKIGLTSSFQPAALCSPGWPETTETLDSASGCPESPERVYSETKK